MYICIYIPFTLRMSLGASLYMIDLLLELWLICYQVYDRSISRHTIDLLPGLWLIYYQVYSWFITNCMIDLLSVVWLIYYQVYEFDIEKKEYTKWSRENSGQFHKSWLRPLKHIMNIAYCPDNSDRILLHTDSSLCVLDKTKVRFYIHVVCFIPHHHPVNCLQTDWPHTRDCQNFYQLFCV